MPVRLAQGAHGRRGPCSPRRRPPSPRRVVGPAGVASEGSDRFCRPPVGCLLCDGCCVDLLFAGGRAGGHPTGPGAARLGGRARIKVLSTAALPLRGSTPSRFRETKVDCSHSWDETRKEIIEAKRGPGCVQIAKTSASTFMRSSIPFILSCLAGFISSAQGSWEEDC
ncbi:hypothetical protein U9M48_006280 [Paspalum notatum var. saurae]|uniref:Uncharacterized protein n=1 Tax=Paspalum notatum var. saurae TaxID=547442 RepID=A0AAQ3PRW9_PASNO